MDRGGGGGDATESYGDVSQVVKLLQPVGRNQTQLMVGTVETEVLIDRGPPMSQISIYRS